MTTTLTAARRQPIIVALIVGEVEQLGMAPGELAGFVAARAPRREALVELERRLHLSGGVGGDIAQALQLARRSMRHGPTRSDRYSKPPRNSGTKNWASRYDATPSDAVARVSPKPTRVGM